MLQLVFRLEVGFFVANGDTSFTIKFDVGLFLTKNASYHKMSF